MATRQSTIDHLLDQIARAGNVTVRKMFGEYCLYLEGKPVGLVCNDQLFVKMTATGRALVPDHEEGSPFPGAKPYLLIPIDDWNNREALCDLLRTTFEELPEAKPRKPRAKKGSGGAS